MNRYYFHGMPLKTFVKEKAEIGKTKNNENTKSFQGVESLEGEKVKRFYEDLIRTCPLEKSDSKNLMVDKRHLEKSVKNVKFRKSQPSSFKNTDLLFLAQNNDIKNLKLFFLQKQEFDINIADDFGWTPLMCASCSGAEGAVKILLENGADPSKTDNLGHTSLKLAKLKNHKTIISLLENLNSNKIEDDEKNLNLPSPDPFFCNICNENFTTNKTDHETSTLHLFNSKHKMPTYYTIPESNKGFQILLKRGWNRETGLGPHGNGRKFPVKAIVKKNRRGIGAPVNEKINHQSINHSLRNKTLKMKMYNQRKEREFEKNFRLEFA